MIKLYEIPLSKVLVQKKRVRISREISEDFLYSIKTYGVLQPITVCPATDKTSFILIHGLRRYIAAAQAGYKTINALVDDTVKAKDILFMELVYNGAERYSLGELVELANYVEKTSKLTSPSQFDNLLGLKEGNYLKLKAILEYSQDTDSLDKFLTDTKSDPDTLIEKAYKKMERELKKKEKEEEEGAEGEDSEDHEEFVEGEDDFDMEEPVVPEEIRNFVVTRDDNTCLCHCGIHGEQYSDILKAYPVKNTLFGGAMTANNMITVCPNCYSLLVRYAMGGLFILEKDKESMRQIVKYGEELKKDILESERPKAFYSNYFKKVL